MEVHLLIQLASASLFPPFHTPLIPVQKGSVCLPLSLLQFWHRESELVSHKKASKSLLHVHSSFSSMEAF